MSSYGLAFEGFIHPAFPLADSLPIARCVVTALLPVFGRLTPSEAISAATWAAHRDPAYEEDLGGIGLVSEVLTPPNCPLDWSIIIRQLHVATTGWAKITLDTPLAPPGQFIANGWALMVAAGAVLLPVLHPTLATINGTAELGARFKDFDLTQLPPVLTPWTFLATSQWAPEKHEALLSIPGARLTQVEGGTLFEVPDFLDRRRRDLDCAVKALPRNPPVKWRPPIPPSDV